MSVKDYIRENIEDSLVNDKEIVFEDTYRLYTEIKKICLQLSKEYDIKLLNYDKTNNNDDNNYTISFKSNANETELINFLNNDLKSIYKKELINDDFTIKNASDLFIFLLISYVSNASKKIESYSKENVGYDEKAIGELKQFITNIPDKLEINDYFEEFDKIVKLFLNNNKNIKYISQSTKYYKDKNKLVYVLNHTSLESLFFKFFLLELVYYSYFYNENPSLEKICPICKKKYYTRGKSCNDCAKEYANHRRKYNAKCNRRRIKIINYLKDYDIISDKLRETASDFIKYHDNNHNDLKELDNLVSKIEKELKSN